MPIATIAYNNMRKSYGCGYHSSAHNSMRKKPTYLSKLDHKSKFMSKVSNQPSIFESMPSKDSSLRESLKKNPFIRAGILNQNSGAENSSINIKKKL